MSREDAYRTARDLFGHNVVIREVATIATHEGKAYEQLACFVGREEGKHTLRELGRGPNWAIALKNAERTWKTHAS
jgi:hypothetical protein